jgi:OFA family oxalate/formate antiporter-like MFS transporter
MSISFLGRALAGRTPFFYGWIVLFAVCCAGFARQGSAVATLSIFVEPMTAEFGWSRTALSGAVSLGGVIAALISPVLGPLLDRHGARMMLTMAVLVTGFAVGSLSFTTSILYFYVAFCIARTCFASPFDLGTYGAVNNWFLRQRAIATAIANVAKMAGLVSMPLVAQFVIQQSGWRESWLAIGAVVLVVGLMPVWLLVGRRPEDLGLEMDGRRAASAGSANSNSPEPIEPAFTRQQAMRTSTFWLLNLVTLLVYPIQAGISLHQAPLLIERGLDATTAAFVIGTFSLCAGIAGLGFGLIVRRFGIRSSLLVSCLVLVVSVIALKGISNELEAYLAAVLFGLALGGFFTVLPVAWADFFGRESYGAIRGIALSVQVTAQASGPLISGVLWDATGNYEASLACFLAFAIAALLVAAFLRRPDSPL